MSYATLLVHVEADAAADSRLALAVDLANRFDARLIGVGAELYRIPSVGYDGYEGGDDAMGVLVAELAAAVDADLARAGEKFQAAAALVRQGADWRAAVEFPVNEVAAQARAADLVVASLGRRDGGSAYSVAAPGALVLQTGRPVLAVPPQATGLHAAKVLIAWKDTRESRRAAHDALPFLKGAAEVLLTEVVESPAAVAASEARLADVAAHLSRHGVKSRASVAVEETDSAAAEQLLDLAARQGAELIVAGAYGHTRLQEWVFGGFTRALLAQSAIAVLFSH